MKMKLLLPVVLSVVLGVGCSNKKSPTQKEAATKQWNHARANVLLGLAKDQYTTGNFESCRKTLDEALGMDPDNSQLRVLSARLAIEQGQLELADKELDRARKADPKSAEPDYLSGVVYERWQKPETAFDFYSAAADKEPGQIEYAMAKSEMLVSMGRQAEALELLQSKMVFFEHSAAIRDAVGQLLVQAGKPEQAVDVLRQARILANDDLTIDEHLGLAMYFALQYRDAAELINRLVKNKPYSEHADLFLVQGCCQMHLGKVREARQSFESAAQLDASLTSAWLGLTRSALQLNDTRRAELSLRKALSLDASSVDARLLLGYLRLQQNRVPDALAAFQRASALDRGDTVSLCMIGYSLQKLGRHEQAIQYYAQALKIKPDDEMASKLMASLEMKD